MSCYIKIIPKISMHFLHNPFKFIKITKNKFNKHIPVTRKELYPISKKMIFKIVYNFFFLIDICIKLKQYNSCTYVKCVKINNSTKLSDNAFIYKSFCPILHCIFAQPYFL